jgi:hypothetical protein
MPPIRNVATATASIERNDQARSRHRVFRTGDSAGTAGWTVVGSSGAAGAALSAAAASRSGLPGTPSLSAMHPACTGNLSQTCEPGTSDVERAHRLFTAKPWSSLEDVHDA